MARHRIRRRSPRPSPLVAAQIILLGIVLAVVLFARTHAGRATANLVGFFGGSGDDVRVTKASTPPALPSPRSGVTLSQPVDAPAKAQAAPGDGTTGGTTDEVSAP